MIFHPDFGFLKRRTRIRVKCHFFKESLSVTFGNFSLKKSPVNFFKRIDRWAPKKKKKIPDKKIHLKKKFNEKNYDLPDKKPLLSPKFNLKNSILKL
jgi:hypothetical protein